MIIQDGTRITETFKNEFLALVEHDARKCELVRYELNVQDGLNVCVSCIVCYASEYLAFVDTLNDELDKHGIALVHVVWFGDTSNERTEQVTIVVNE